MKRSGPFNQPRRTLKTEKLLSSSPSTKLVGAKGGGRRMRGNWGMNSSKNVFYARCAGSLQVGLLERKVHATTARQRAL